MHFVNNVISQTFEYRYCNKLEQKIMIFVRDLPDSDFARYPAKLAR